MGAIDERKKKLIKEIIKSLHKGMSADEAKRRILTEVGALTSSEITDIEQSLIDEGVEPDEIRKFCNVHALIFESALEKSVESPDSPSHPVNLLRRENREIERIIADLKSAADGKDLKAVRANLAKLKGLDRHYALKENAIFPYLEKHGFVGPSKVMWGKHNEVRELLKRAEASAAAGSTDYRPDLDALVAEAEGMIFKEENILFPASIERLSTQEWVAILSACDEIGFPFVHEGLHSAIEGAEAAVEAAADASAAPLGAVALPTGTMSPKELAAMLDTLPVDVTFVDANDTVSYFSESKDRIFVRARSIIGRNVRNCHPPQSVHRVLEIVEAFKKGSRDHADFWIQLNGRFVLIRYYAVRDVKGSYLGTLEVTQDITDIRKLEGERRLLDEGK